MLSILKSNRYIAPNVPISEIGTASAGISVAREPPQEHEDHHDHQRDHEQQRELNIVHRLADRARAVVEHLDLGIARQVVLEARQHRLDAIHHIDRVGFGCRCTRKQDRRGCR